jgi:CxxC motif-containing protein (DUF1111 family)
MKVGKSGLLRGVVVVVGGVAAAAGIAFAGGGLRDDPAARGDDDKVLMASGPVAASAPAGSRRGGGGQPQFGDPLAGLTAEQLDRFNVGKALFEHGVLPEEGLGPVFNKDRCSGCHESGGVGGAGTIAVTRFGRIIGKDEFDPMVDFGGSLLQSDTIDPECAEVLPEGEFDIMAQRVTTPTFGAGLIEAIPDETILALEDPFDDDGDGISGRAHIVFDPIDLEERVGRFGWKAQVATLDTFSADAQFNETGVTNVVFSVENDPNGIFPPAIEDCDTVPDPEDVPDGDGVSNFNRMADFQRFLAPPPRVPLLSSRGFALFREIGCADCHTPVMFTGVHEVAALSRRPVFLFSDLLLHDMGSLGDQIEQDDAAGFEMRTSPLWGLRVRERLLHDGRDNMETPLIPFAIEAHAGEAAASRDAWLELTAREKAFVVKFLNSI